MSFVASASGRFSATQGLNHSAKITVTQSEADCLLVGISHRATHAETGPAVIGDLGEQA